MSVLDTHHFVNFFLSSSSFFFCVFVTIFLQSVVCVSFCRLITTNTSVLDDSDGKTYLIKHRYQFKSRSSVCCRTGVL